MNPCRFRSAGVFAMDLRNVLSRGYCQTFVLQGSSIQSISLLESAFIIVGCWIHVFIVR